MSYLHKVEALLGELLMGYLNKVEAKLRLKLGSQDLDKMGLIRLPNKGKVVTREEFSELEGLTIGSNKLEELLVAHPNLKLPAGLKVSGDLSLRKTRIKSLPTGLEVEGDLDLRNTKITKLPLKLKIKGILDLSETKVKALPSDLQVENDILITRDMKKTFRAGKFKNKVKLRLGGDNDAWDSLWP